MRSRRSIGCLPASPPRAEAAVHILHLHSSFAPGGKEARAVRLINAFGASATHSIVSAVPGALGARAAIAPGIDARFPADAPPLAGRPGLARYRALAGYMAGFDLILTYNWGAMDAVMARRLFGGPPLVHHEDGFGADEAVRLNGGRNLFRRIALPGAAALVVPSRRLEAIARSVWKQPAARLHRIENGVPIDSRIQRPEPLPGFVRRRGRPVVGSVAGLRPVKNLPRLVRVVAAAGGDADLLILGDGPERGAILAEARARGIAGRVHLPGHVAAPWRHIGLFDVFVLSSDSEQAPLSLIEAMAAGLPVVAPAVGDIAAMVAVENRPFITPADDEAALARALAALLADRRLRRAVGAANRAVAADRFDESMMIAAYRGLYQAAAQGLLVS